MPSCRRSSFRLTISSLHPGLPTKGCCKCRKCRLQSFSSEGLFCPFHYYRHGAHKFDFRYCMFRCPVLACHFTYKRSCSDLQEMIDASSDTSSPFHMSHASTSTDLTIYPDPSGEQRQDSKKRKVADGESRINGASAEHARYTAAVHTNKHLESVYEIVKKECDELARLCVGSAQLHSRLCAHIDASRMKFRCGYSWLCQSK